MKKVLLVATVQSHIAQFHRPLIELLNERGYEIHVAARNNLKEKNGLDIWGANEIFSVPFHRFPFHPKNIKAYIVLRRIINAGEYDIISCNTPVGGILTRLAARKVRKKGAKVVYTAHGFHFYKGASKKNWIMYYPLEKLMARSTDTLITVSEEDYLLANAKFKTNVQRIHGVGLDTEKFSNVSLDAIEKAREDFGCVGKFVLLCVGELNANKNQSTVIRAVRQVVDTYPDVVLLLAGNGPKEQELRYLVKELDLEDNVKLIGYRTDLEVFTHLCDIIVSASFREGLGMNLLEGMFCGKPAVASRNRGHNELIVEGKNGYLVEADSAEEFAQKIMLFFSNKETYAQIAENNKTDHNEYSQKNVKRELEKIYFDV